MKTDYVAPFELWHKRLGYPSLQVTNLVPGVILRRLKIGRIRIISLSKGKIE